MSREAGSLNVWEPIATKTRSRLKSSDKSLLSLVSDINFVLIFRYFAAPTVVC